MKVRSLSLVGWSQLVCSISFATSLVCFSGLAVAQDGLALEDLEKQVMEQRIALEQAIANREATALKAREVQNAIDESEARKRKVLEELKALCEEQELIKKGSIGTCIDGLDS